jgi:hypothetical protein
MAAPHHNQPVCGLGLSGKPSRVGIFQRYPLAPRYRCLCLQSRNTNSGLPTNWPESLGAERTFRWGVATRKLRPRAGLRRTEVLIGVFHAGEALFHTRWFIESLATQVLVVFAIRTRRPFFRSRPHRLLIGSAAAIITVAALLPFSPLALWLGNNEVKVIRWGFPPVRLKGAPIINFRSERRRFPGRAVPRAASYFFKFTGAKSPKTKWKFTKTGEDWFCFAGL